MNKTPHAPNCDSLNAGECTCGTAELETLVRCTEFAEAPWSTDLRVILNGKTAWPDLGAKKVVRVTRGVQLAGLPERRANEGPAVAMRIELPDGQIVLMETSLRLLYTAVQALVARYGNPSPWGG
jgi:hypothetical protein